MEDDNRKPKLVKPAPSFMEKFRAKKAPTIAGVETMLSAPLKTIGDIGDFFRLHWDEDNFWSPPLCFVNVPIKGAKKDVMHVIDEEIAMQHLHSRRILRKRLALASKPHDKFFFLIVPAVNLDNSFNASNLKSCEEAKTTWITASSRTEEGIDEYKIEYAKDADAFDDPKWPKRSLDELLEVTFRGACIETNDHPALLRLIGAKQRLT